MPESTSTSVSRSARSAKVDHTIAFLGLGNMGTPMAQRLVAAGLTVVAFDVSAAATDRLVSVGATRAATARQAVAGADLVLLMLPNSDVVQDVVDDVLDLLAPDAIVIDLSSSEPLRTRQLATKLDARGVRMLDSPVSGGVRGAENGTLTIMLGGPGESVDVAIPVLELMGRPVHVGAVGAGHALKALNNLLSATHLMATCEAMITGQRFGLDPSVMLDVLNSSSGRSGSTENKWPNFILPESYDSGFALSLMVKDMRIATELADELDTPSLLGSHAVELWTKAAAKLSPGADHTEIATWLSSLYESR